MAKTNKADGKVKRPESEKSNTRALARALPRAFVLGAVSGIVAFGPGGPKGGLAALAGALAAGLYVATYLQSHLGSIGQRTRVFDPSIARSAILRMFLTALGAWGSFVAGRMALLSYLLSFALAFFVLLLFEIPNTRRVLQEKATQ